MLASPEKASALAEWGGRCDNDPRLDFKDALSLMGSQQLSAGSFFMSPTSEIVVKLGIKKQSPHHDHVS